MRLTDPSAALAEQSNFVSYLVGLAGLAEVVRVLAADNDGPVDPPRTADDFVHLLLGLASLGNTIENIAKSATAQRDSTEPASSAVAPTARWLR